MKETKYTLHGLDERGYSFGLYFTSEGEARMKYDAMKNQVKSIKLQRTTIDNEVLEESSAAPGETRHTNVSDVQH